METELQNGPVFPLLSIARLRMGTDGTGVTTLVAGAGCPLCCRWCINRKLLRDAPAEYVTASELLDRVKIDDLYFRTTGGGITFGGGESLLHADFIAAFRKICPQEWRIVAETSLAVPAESVKIAAENVSFFLVDCKDMDERIYRSYTGGDAERMKANLRYLIGTVGPERILVRVPHIPEYNTEADQKRSLSELRAMGIENTEVFD